MNHFSEQQEQSANLAIEAFRRNVISWVILLAQMQSGKTETYLLVACELIRHNLVKNVVIFSGNAEIDLRDQLKDQLKIGSRFFEKYQNRLSNQVGKMQLDFTQLFQQISKIPKDVEDILSNITVVWGSELNTYYGPKKNTLFIWEEAHYAQTKEQRPDKFLHSIGVSADGNAEHLQRNSNLMMTISATPFSELSDNLRQAQGKFVVKMVPGNGYVSVKDIQESGRIVPFANRERSINDALNLPKHGKKWYAIIRVQNRRDEMVKSTIESNGWDWVTYDSVSENQEKGESMWKNMHQEPAKNTVILIRGKCRMGKNLEKKHLLFVFETSNNSRTDTVLQSLLGRTCGYSEGSERVIVYLSDKIAKSGEIERYIKMWEHEDVQIMPTMANNLAKKKVKTQVPIIPEKFTLPDGVQLPDSTRLKEKFIKTHLKQLIKNDANGLVSKNSESAREELKQKILNGKLKCHFGGKIYNENKAREIIDAYERGVAREFGSGCGIDRESTEVNIWILPNSPEFNSRTIYITANVTREDMEEFNIPTTTGKEVFATRLEDGTEVEGNGGMTIRLSSHTANDATAMKNELCTNMIEVSLRTEGCDRKITSCWDDDQKEFKGILVTPEIYRQLNKGGYIYEHVEREYGLSLHIRKSSGVQPKSVSSRVLIKLASISW